MISSQETRIRFKYQIIMLKLALEKTELRNIQWKKLYIMKINLNNHKYLEICYNDSIVDKYIFLSQARGKIYRFKPK